MYPVLFMCGLKKAGFFKILFPPHLWEASEGSPSLKQSEQIFLQDPSGFIPEFNFKREKGSP